MPKRRLASCPPSCFLAMAAGPNATASTDEILRDVRAQIGSVLPR